MTHDNGIIAEVAFGPAQGVGACSPCDYAACEPEALGGREAAGFFSHLDALEQPLVRFVMRFSRHPAAHAFTSLVNRLGNGWLYAIVLVSLVAWQADGAVRPALAASCSLIIAFAFYWWLKPRLARLRPCDADPLSNASIAPLDKYSFPSGHCMSASAVALPLLLSFPGAQPLILVVAGLIAWSRIACGHHYLTDVLAGTVLGAAVALPVCGLIL